MPNITSLKSLRGIKYERQPTSEPAEKLSPSLLFTGHPKTKPSGQQKPRRSRHSPGAQVPAQATFCPSLGPLPLWPQPVARGRRAPCQTVWSRPGASSKRDPPTGKARHFLREPQAHLTTVPARSAARPPRGTPTHAPARRQDAPVSAHLLALLALLLHVAACGPRGPPREPHRQRPLHARSGPATPALTAPPARPQSPPRPRPTRTSGPRKPAHRRDPAPSCPAHSLRTPALPPKGTRWAHGGRSLAGQRRLSQIPWKRPPITPDPSTPPQGGRSTHAYPPVLPIPSGKAPQYPPALPNPSGPRGIGSNFSILPPSLGRPISQPASRSGRRASNPGSGRAATWQFSLFTLSHKETLF